LDGGYDAKTDSVYGRETYYEAAGSRSRSYSPLPAPSGYQSGRNSPVFTSSRPGSMANMMMQKTSRPVTNYLDMSIARSGSPFLDGGNGMGGHPIDAELERVVNNLLRSADLSTVTKRDLRRRVEEALHCDLSSRKADLNAMIDRALMANS
jgi:chitin synthase